MTSRNNNSIVKTSANSDGILRITLNNPKNHNALSEDMMLNMQLALDEAAADKPGSSGNYQNVIHRNCTRCSKFSQMIKACYSLNGGRWKKRFKQPLRWHVGFTASKLAGDHHRDK